MVKKSLYCLELQNMILIVFCAQCVKSWQDRKAICIFVSFLADKETEIKGNDIYPTFLIKSWEENKMDHILSLWQPEIIF